MPGINILKSMRLSDSGLGAGNRVCLLVQRLVLFLALSLDSQCPFLQAHRLEEAFSPWKVPNFTFRLFFSLYLSKTSMELVRTDSISLSQRAGVGGGAGSGGYWRVGVGVKAERLCFPQGLLGERERRT